MIAFDTNVLLYACDRADSRRQQIAIDNLDGARRYGCFALPVQHRSLTNGRNVAHSMEVMNLFLGG
jgi:hypothetical protein